MKIRKKIRTIIGICFLMAGIGYFFYPDFREWKTQKKVDQIVSEFETEKKKVTESAEAEKNSEEDVHKSMLPDLYNALQKYNQDLNVSGQQIVDAWSYEQPPVDINLLNNGSPVIGYIEIPDIELRLPLYLGASLDHLAEGAAVLSQTSMPIGGKDTNCVIAGHRGFRGESFFHYIDELQMGSKVYITNPWETLTYQVVGTKVILPDQVEDIMIQKDKDMVTLISCHPYAVGGGTKRYLVYCERDQSVEKDGVEKSDTSSETEKRSTEQKDVQENRLQRWERGLRIVVPAGIILFGCIMIFRKKDKNS